MSNDLDFNSLAGLYKTDPEKFRTVSRQMIEDYIAGIPDEISKRKCAGIQFKLDHELRKYQDPIARMNKMVEIFWHGVNQFNNALNGNVEIKENNRSDTVVLLTSSKKPETRMENK